MRVLFDKQSKAGQTLNIMDEGSDSDPGNGGDDSAFATYEALLAQRGFDKSHPYKPFISKLDWEIAKWGKLRGPTSTALGDLLGINGVRHKILAATHFVFTAIRFPNAWASHTTPFEVSMLWSTIYLPNGHHLSVRRSPLLAKHTSCISGTS